MNFTYFNYNLKVFDIYIYISESLLVCMVKTNQSYVYK